MESRYERQILLDEIGLEGQERLKQSKVLVVGAGGLGSPVLTYLACAGVGTIRVIDNDVVSTTNLNRQFFYNHMDVDYYKVLIAQEKLQEQNPEIRIEAHNNRLSADNVDELLVDIDVVVDCVDNIATRLLLNKVCLKKKIPLVEGGVQGFYGFATVIQSGYPCLECMGVEDVLSKGPAPVIGVTAGIIGCIEAQECLKILLGLGSDLYGVSLQYDGIKQKLQRVSIKIDPECSHHTKNESR